MRLVHLSDLHLGFRQFQRQTPAGINQREADVAATCARAIEQVIALAPDVILLGGDVFHHVRPTNTAILDGFRLFARLRTALPDAMVVIIAGNHDVPRTTDSGCILQLFRELDVHVVDREAERIDVAGAGPVGAGGPVCADRRGAPDGERRASRPHARSAATLQRAPRAR